MKYRALITILLVSTFVGITLFDSQINAVETYFFELEIVTNGGGVRPDYGMIIAEQLREIGIKANLKVIEWYEFLGILLATHDFEMNIIGLSGGGVSPDMREIYSESGSLNMFELDTTMPYGALSETMQNEGVTITDLEERQQHYYDWEQLLMDKLIPIVPLFASRIYEGIWSNTIGFENNWGLVNSLPYLEFYGYHDGQVSQTEFNVADANWRDLNPLFTDDSSSEFLFSLISEPVVGWSPDLIPLKTGLVTDWEQIDEFHYKFTMRDDVYWNPSFNITGRDASSDPLATTPLMVGLKDGTVSDGTNHQVTAKDAVFTYLAYANPIVSESPTYHNWISACYVDPYNPLSFHIEIDGNPSTPEIEQYADFWSRLPWEILPEFFLNSTDPTTSLTSGGVQCTGFYFGIETTPQWVSYSSSAFNCGKYMLDYYIKNSVSVLQSSPYWMNIGLKDGTTQDLDISTVNIRVIPDSLTELAEFKAGKLDWIDLSNFPDDRREMQLDSRFDIQSKLAADFTFLAFNLQSEKIGGSKNFDFLTEPGKEDYTIGLALRKAISYAINRVSINSRVNFGEKFIANCPIYPITSYYYYDDIIKYDFNLGSAWEWMESAGYSQGDLTTALTFTSYDDPIETTTVTNNYTTTTYITNVTTITLPGEPYESPDVENSDPSNPASVTTNSLVPILILASVLLVIALIKKLSIYKKK